MKNTKVISVPSAIIGGFIAFMICLSLIENAHRSEVEVIVSDKWVKRYGEADMYLIYTDKETYCVSDSLLIPRFNSSDVYGAIEVGKSYKFEVRGYRVPFLSWYKNIAFYEEIDEEK